MSDNVQNKVERIVFNFIDDKFIHFIFKYKM